MNILQKIIETKRNEVAAAVAVVSFEEIHAAAQAAAMTRSTVSFSRALASSPTGIIAEFKRKSPSRGYINRFADVSEVVGGYAMAGAAAISVLTDSEYFGGSPDDLRAARKVARRVVKEDAECRKNLSNESMVAPAVEVPLIRKDFIVDEYQLCEARVAGADAVLLIAAALSPERCRELALFAVGLGLEVLLELHDASEIGHICPEISMIGVNNRDLRSFVTDVGVSEKMGELLNGLPDEVSRDMVRVSESGISSPETVKRLRERGFRGFLMGENFMRQGDPAAALVDFLSELRA